MKINIISSTRADFGLLKNLIGRLKKEKVFLRPQLLAGRILPKDLIILIKKSLKTK